MSTYKFWSLVVAVMAVLISMPAFSGKAFAEGGAAKSPSAVKGYKVKNSEILYLQMTYPNFFRLAWAMGVYSTEDSEALDTYLMISECNLHKKYFNNEFEWEKVKKAAKNYLESYGQNVSKYYEYTQPVELGRYDISLQGFPLEETDKHIALKSLQIASYKPGETECGQVNIDRGKYPGSGVMNVMSPLSLTFIRVPKELAEEYISWRSSLGLTNSARRMAYIKYKVRIDDFVKNGLIGGTPSLIFNGRLMEINVYADKEMIMPLYNQLF